MTELLREVAWYVALFAVLLSIGACGSPAYEDPPQAGASASAEDRLVAQECGRCHNGSNHPARIGSVAQFQAKGGKGRVQNGSMPPDRRLDGNVKARLLNL